MQQLYLRVWYNSGLPYPLDVPCSSEIHAVEGVRKATPPRVLPERAGESLRLCRMAAGLGSRGGTQAVEHGVVDALLHHAGGAAGGGGAGAGVEGGGGHHGGHL